MKNILVAVDFNHNEQLLLDKAFVLAQAFGSKVWLIHIADPDPDFVGYGVGPEFLRDERAIEIRKEHVKIQEYSNQLKEKDIDTEGLLVKGATIEMILKESQKLNVDLIIAGHHDHGFFYKAILGSVSASLLKKSKIPLLFIALD